MTDTADTTVEAEPKFRKRDRKKGSGAGRPAPSLIFTGANILDDEPDLDNRQPVEYSDELATRVCKWLAAGKSLRSFCLQPGTPDPSSIVEWTLRRPDFAQRYAQARDIGTDRIAEKILDALDDPDLPPEQVARVRELTNARKWYVSKIAPRRYGDRLDVRQEISGPNGGPIQAQVLLDVLLTPANLDRLTDIEVESIRSAAAKLALPAPQVVEATATPVIEAVASSVHSECSSEAAGEVSEVEPADEAGEG
jgi:hypothetical protein